MRAAKAPNSRGNDLITLHDDRHVWALPLRVVEWPELTALSVMSRGRTKLIFSAKLDGQPVVVKMGHREVLSIRDMVRVERGLQREAKILSGIQHPNVVAILAHGTVNPSAILPGPEAGAAICIFTPGAASEVYFTVVERVASGLDSLLPLGGYGVNERHETSLLHLIILSSLAKAMLYLHRQE